MNTKGQRSSHRERLQRPVTMIVRLQRSINHDRQTGSEKPAAGGGLPSVGLRPPSVTPPRRILILIDAALSS